MNMMNTDCFVQLSVKNGPMWEMLFLYAVERDGCVEVQLFCSAERDECIEILVKWKKIIISLN